VVQELDDASPEAVERLLEAADDLVARREADLEAVARALEENLAGTARDRPTA
jgi:hypothetical protein